MVVREIDVGRDLISPESVHTGTVPILENHIDVGIVPIPKSHVDTGTVPILKSCVNAGTFHVHADKPTGVRIP